MPKFVFEITEEEWQRLSHVLNMSYVNAEGEEQGLSFDEALKRIFLLGLYHLEHDVHGGSDHDKEGNLDLPPDVAGGNH